MGGAQHMRVTEGRGLCNKAGDYHINNGLFPNEHKANIHVRGRTMTYRSCLGPGDTGRITGTPFTSGPWILRRDKLLSSLGLRVYRSVEPFLCICEAPGFNPQHQK